VLLGFGISENDVDTVEIADMAERHPTELRGVGHNDHPLRDFGGGTLHRRLGEQVSRDARLGVDATGTHHACVEPELRERRLDEATRQRQLSRTDLPAWKEELDAWALVQLEDRPESEGHDGHPTAAKGASHLHGGRPTVENDRFPVSQEAGSSSAYRHLGLAGVKGPKAIRTLLSTEKNACRAAVHPSQPPTALERLEVTPHCHFRALQCGGELPHQYRTAVAEGLHDQLLTPVNIHYVHVNIFYVSSPTPNERPSVNAVVFDVGGVLLDWDPRHLYRKLFADEAKMEWFLTEICTPAWHASHDRGVSTAASCAELAARHPQFSELIWAWSNRSEEMIGGVDAGSVDVLRAVRETGLPCYALTNMEAETYPLRLERFAVLGWFDGTIVSGREGIAKPEPAIFTRLLDRFRLTARTTLMIDDTKENLETASNLGIQTVLFRSSRQLRAELEAAAVLPRSVVANQWTVACRQLQARCWDAPACLQLSERI
jgi:2-haloacid dehalogenase